MCVSFKEIKIKLYSDHTLLQSILEKIGIHDITIKRKYLQGALPDGDNPTSFCVNITDDYLHTDIFTRADYKGSDIIDAIIYVSGKKSGDVSRWLREEVGISKSFNKKKTKEKSFLDEFVAYDRYSGNSHRENTIISEKSKGMFVPYANKIWADEEISIDTQYEFEVMYDVLDSRIVFPFRDRHGRLITFIGRTTKEQQIGNPKYLSYYPFNGSKLLYGLNKAEDYINKSNEVIIVEAPKSVMKAWDMGYKNVVALNKKKLSEAQRDLIMSLNCTNIVIALDKDVSHREVCDIASRFKGMKHVSIVFDRDNLLDEKDSPFDCGEMIWDELYEEREKYEA